MARRNDIIEALVTDLGQIDSVDPANVSRKYRFLDDVNDFPYITFVPRQELRRHRGDGRKHASLVVDVRAYVYDGDSEDICEVAEDLADSIEAKIDQFAASHRDLAVEEAEVEASFEAWARAGGRRLLRHGRRALDCIGRMRL